jgi:hypothetical protein
MEQKRFKPPSRASGNRDAKLIIIATEGEVTEKKYFEDLAFAYQRPDIYVKVLEKVNPGSDPEAVITQLDDFRRQYSRRKNFDELWLVVDVDRWNQKKLSAVGVMCIQKNYGYAVSNPCFELWLLLHLKSLGEYPLATLQEFRENKRTHPKHGRTRLEIELISLLGSYNKSNPDTSKFIINVQIAIERTKALDVNMDHRWPNDLGSRVYLLAEKVVNE